MNTTDAEQSLRDGLIRQIHGLVHAGMVSVQDEEDAPTQSKAGRMADLIRRVYRTFDQFYRKDLNEASTDLLQRLAAASPVMVCSLLDYDIWDEPHVTELLMHGEIFDEPVSCLKDAIAEVKSVLGVGHLSEVAASQRAGVTAAINIALYWRDLMEQINEYWQPGEGYLTPELMPLIFAYPQREREIMAYIHARETSYDLVDFEYLKLKFDSTLPLASGVL